MVRRGMVRRGMVRGSMVRGGVVPAKHGQRHKPLLCQLTPLTRPSHGPHMPAICPRRGRRVARRGRRAHSSCGGGDCVEGGGATRRVVHEDSVDPAMQGVDGLREVSRTLTRRCEQLFRCLRR